MDHDGLAVSGRTIAIIPARGGSKGVPRKNLRLLAGKPLIVHSIEQAVAASRVDDVLVSTDDEEIGTLAGRHGAQVIWRPAELASDTASSEVALEHAIAEFGSKIPQEIQSVVFLQCTSPLRLPSDIDEAVATMENDGADSLLSVCCNHRFLWRQGSHGAEPINYDHRNRPRRQDMTPQYIENGSIYVFRPWVLTKYRNRLGGRIAMHIMEEHTSVEIDTEFDFSTVEAILRSKSSKSTQAG